MSFLRALSRGLKPGSIIMNQNEKSAGKRMLTLFWNMTGPILEHYHEKGETINSVSYSTMLEEKQSSSRTSIQRRPPSPWQCTTTHCCCNRYQHPETEIWDPYSPDLAPSDYYVFGTLKEALRGRRFHSDDEVKEREHFWLRQQPTNYFYWETEGCREMWRMHCKGRWIHGKITYYLDLYIWCASQYNAICPYWSP
jgi:hypothetical protein